MCVDGVTKECTMSENCHTSMVMVALVGPAHKVMWRRQHDWRKWFLKTEQHVGHCQFHIDGEVEMAVYTQLQVQKDKFYHSRILDSC